VREVTDAQVSFFRLVYGRILNRGARRPARGRGELFRLAKKPGFRERWRASHFFRRSKVRATLRWFKYMLTFDSWLDYILRKIERRSAQRVELTARRGASDHLPVAEGVQDDPRVASRGE
jgi:hypothetical protein